MKRICVFCGSNAGHDPRYRTEADALRAAPTWHSTAEGSAAAPLTPA